GHRLIVGDDVERIEALDRILMIGFALTLCGILALGGFGGYWLSLGVQRRFAAMSAVAEAISDGDLKQRMTVRQDGDDLDQLGSTVNRMLDHIDALMDSLRQV